MASDTDVLRGSSGIRISHGEPKRTPVGEALDGGQRFLIWWLPCDFMGACATKKDKTIFFSPLIHFQLKVKSTLFYPMLLTTDNFLKKINQLAENKINITWLSISTSNDNGNRPL